MAATVLIVDDAEGSAETLEIALSTLPEVVVSWVRSAEQALRIVASQPVRAVITDLHMAKMDGFELIERLRADARTTHLPVIVVSGDSDPETPHRVRRLGADAYFAKPYSPGAVRAAVERLLHANTPERGS